MEFNPDGTIDTEYGELSVPKSGQIYRFQKAVESARRRFQKAARALADRLAEEEPADDDPLTEEAADFSIRGWLDYTADAYRATFSELGVELPEEVDEWPAMLMRSDFAGELIRFWREYPKVFGKLEGQ